MNWYWISTITKQIESLVYESESNWKRKYVSILTNDEKVIEISMKYMKYAYMSWLYKVHLIQDAVITQPYHLHFDN